MPTLHIRIMKAAAGVIAFFLKEMECKRITLTPSGLGFQLWKGWPIQCLPWLLGYCLPGISPRTCRIHQALPPELSLLSLQHCESAKLPAQLLRLLATSFPLRSFSFALCLHLSLSIDKCSRGNGVEKIRLPSPGSLLHWNLSPSLSDCTAL